MQLNRRNGLLGVFALVAIMGVVVHRSSTQPQPTRTAAPDPLIKSQERAALALSPEQRIATINAYQKLPLTFEENKGQAGTGSKFIARGNGYSLYLTPTEALLSLHKATSKASDAPSVLRMKLANANASSTIRGDEKSGGKTNYFIGNTIAATDISQYKKVHCDNVYAGIDMVYYGNQRQLEYDFVVAPGADPKAIRMAFTGSEKVEVNAVGELSIRIGQSEVKQHKPVIYQTVGGEKKIVVGTYEIVASAATAKDETIVGFNIADYDRTVPLVIDPVLVYATFYGDLPNYNKNSDHSGDDVGLAVAIDSAGAAYVVGKTNTFEFPLVNNIQFVSDFSHADFPTAFHSTPETYKGFITKFLPDGTDIVYSTYLCGSGNDECRGVVIDISGNAYICGATSSSNFPIKKAQHAYSGGVDGFLMKLTPTGTDIVFSTFLGGAGDDSANDLALDSAGNVIVVGTTSSANFVISHAVQPTFGGGTDAFVASFSADGTVNAFSTYLGGTGNDTGNGVTVDSFGSIFVTGSTTSLNFPISHPYQVNIGGGSDAFVTKLNSTGTLLVYSTYLGGSGDDVGYGIAVDSTGNVYVTGSTASTNFPTISPTILPVQSSNGGPSGTTDAFVSKFNIFGSSLIFSTYLGGSMNDVGKRIRVDSRNAIYVSGTTVLTAGGTAAQNNFPVAPKTNTLQPGHSGLADGFLAKFNPTGTPLVYSTYIGSDTHVFQTENGLINANAPTSVVVNGLAIDNDGNAFLTGSTDGSFYYTFGSYRRLPPNFPAPGEDFPAPHIREIINTTTNQVIAQPAEFNTLLNIDESDIIIAKIKDNSPIITSPLLALGTLGASFTSYVITAENAPQSFDAAGLPPGLSVNTVSGQISGIPIQAGIYNVVLTATNQSGTGSQILTISISSAKPTMTSGSVATGNVGAVFQFNLTADNNPGSYALTPVSPTASLPVGITLDAITGLISGVPVVEGTYQFDATATNANGTSLPQRVSINVLPAAPVITSPVNVQAVLNLPFNFSITASGNPQVYNATPNVSQVGTILTLAIGLQLDTSTGIISGTPNTLGFYKFMVSATNAGGTGTQEFNLTVIPALVPIVSSSSNASAIYNEPFSFKITASNSPLVFGIIGALPAGLSLDDQTGIISGIVTPVVLPSIVSATESGNTVTITTSAAHGLSAGQILVISNISVAGYNGIFTVATTPTATTFTYTNPNSQLAASGAGVCNALVNATAVSATEIGNTCTVTTAVAHGFVPGQTVTNSNFAIVGYNGSFVIASVPSTTTFTFVNAISGLAATGAGDCVEQFLATQINASASGSIVTITTANAHGLTVGQTVLITNFAVAGYNGQFTITSVPTSTTFTYTNLAAGFPNATGGVYSTSSIFNLTQTAANIAGQGTKPLTLVIYPPAIPVITSPLIANAVVNAPFEYDILAANHPTSYNAIGLPAGLALNSATGQIIGIPTVSGQFLVTIQASNVGGTGTSTLTLNVAPQQTPIIVSANQANGFVGIPFSYQIAATANPTSFGAAPLPANLVLNPGGLITGTPAAAGVYVITLNATNPIGMGTKILTLTVTVPSAPVFTSPLSVNGIDGSAFNYNITATGIGPIQFTAAGLPPGLTLVGSTILGTPTNGITNVILTAFSPATSPTTPGGPPNAFGVAPTVATLTLNISATAAAIVNSNLTATGTVGQPFSYIIQASGSQPLFITANPLPAGLSLVGNTIQGTPTPAAVTLGTPFPVTLTASNSFTSNNSSKILLITINAAKPNFTSSSFVQGIDGTPFRYVAAATGTQIITYSIDPLTPLPSGLALTGSIISGTPTSAAVGTTTVTLLAKNSGGSTTMSLVIQINPAPPVLSLPGSVTGSAGVPFTFTIPATGSPQIDFTIPNLPAGLIVDIDKIVGTPTTPGIYNVIVSATNPAGTDNKPLTIVINPAPPTISAVSITGFDAIPLIPVTLQVTGAQPISFVATNLPNGITINANTGVISGTPIGYGSTIATITATNSGGAGTQNIVFNISPSKPKITSPLIVQATPGVAFTYTIVAVGTPAITYQAFNLPGGLTITGAVISGTPTGPIGKVSVTLLATNNFGNDQQTLDIDVQQTPPTITNVTLQASGQEFAPFSYTLTATGSPPISFAASPLPTGLTINPNTGVISGNPIGIGSFNVNISATNLFGSDTGKVLVISIAKAPPKITSTLTAGGGINEPFTYTITATGSTTIVFGAQSLPPGLSVNQTTGVISGTPATTGTFAVSILAANTAGSDTQTLTITITANPPLITSPLSATTGTIQAFTYTITASGSGPLTYNATNLPLGLSFSGNKITGTPVQQGVYHVTISATNPLGSDFEILTITVLDDSDGDGFPDDLEVFMNTDPSNPASNGFTGGTGIVKVLNVKQMAVKLNFTSAASDTIALKGTLDLAPNFAASGKPAVVYVSGIAANLTVNAKTSTSISMKPKASGGATPFTLTFGKANYKTKLANVGMTNEEIKTPRTVSTLVIVFVNNTLYRSDKVLTYTAHANKSGAAKQSN